MDLANDPRAAQARDWAAAALKTAFEGFEPASADASFRRYFRARRGERTWIVMDAPPRLENCEPFVRIAGLLQNAGLNTPRILAQDLTQGFLLLNDLGRQTFLDVIDADNSDSMFDSAIAALVRWQSASVPGVLPPYDAPVLHRELALFPEWYLGRHLGVELDAAAQAAWTASADALVQAALAQAPVYVHRDYMPRNLMVTQPAPGVLDFQDALYGPIAYDVISLFKDAFHSWPQARVDGWIGRYWQAARTAGLPVPDEMQFRRDCDWIGLQRHLKILGIFARLSLRDGKPKYLADTPRFVRYVMEVAPRYPELAGLVALFEQHVCASSPSG